MTEPSEEASGAAGGRSAKSLIVLAVVLVLGGVLVAKALSGPTATPKTGTIEDASLTSVHTDAVDDYDAALESGKPVYVLFHSLTCAPCVQISAVADAVVPEYEGKVAFVNAITDDPSGKELASRFQFQYIPTSFFLNADGSVASSYTGVLTAEDLRARLDALSEAR